MRRTLLNTGCQRRVLATLVLAALIAAGCGEGKPNALQSAPTTAPTTFDTSKQYAGEDRGQSDTTSRNGEGDGENVDQVGATSTPASPRLTEGGSQIATSEQDDGTPPQPSFRRTRLPRMLS